MKKKQKIKESVDTAQASNGAVSLIIDYSNGVQKSFAGIPWKGGRAVPDLLQVASSISPGLRVKFAKSFVDRAGCEVGVIVSINGVEAAKKDQKWLVWVNSKFIGTELRSVTPESVSDVCDPLIEPGDVVLLKLAAGP